VAGLFVVVHFALRPAPRPDVGAVARSPAVVDADTRATAVLDDRLTDAVGLASWLVPEATAVRDVCSTRLGLTFGGPYQPVTCVRTVTRYLAFDSDFAARNGAWDEALRSAGWYPGTDTMDSALYRYQATAGQPDGNPSAAPVLATDLPGVEYTAAGRVYLRIEWAERPKLPPGSFPVVDPGRASADSLTVIRAAKPVDVDAVVRGAFTAHRYLAAVTVSQTYYLAGHDSPSPTASQPPGHACYSGSTNYKHCPGG
jgi:hypothetical protein